MFLYYCLDSITFLFLFLCIKNSLQGHSLYLPAVFIGILLSALHYFYLTHDTHLINVWMNSHPSTPLIYKICGVWGNHQGSLLWLLALFTFWAAIFFKDSLTIRLGSLFLCGFGLYVFFNANPFTVFSNSSSPNGQDLTPALQNFYIMIHPPILYAGYTLTFVLWGLCLKNPQDKKLSFLTPLCLLFMTLGIVLGSLWAYKELGWGGFWFWDPVETVSLFPWLALAAALHAKSIPLKRILTLSAFPLVLLGLTLVRSGILASVHSFGVDLNNAIWLGFLSFLITIITIVIWKKKPSPESLSINNDWTTLPFIIFLFLIFLVTITPLLWGVTIHEHFFSKILNPTLIILLALCALAPDKTPPFTHVLLALLATCSWHLWMQPFFHTLSIIAVFVSFWIVFSILPHIRNILKKGFIFSHIGVALCILGASHGEFFQTHYNGHLTKKLLTIGTHTLQFTHQKLIKKTNCTENCFIFNCSSKTLTPKRTFYPISNSYKHEIDWVSKGLDHIYIAVLTNNSNTLDIDVSIKPLLQIFWIGLMFIIFGLGITLYIKTRKYRVQ